MKLPTILGKQLLTNKLKPFMEKPDEAYLAVAAFQRMSLVSDYDTACKALDPWLKGNIKSACGQDTDLQPRLQLVHNIVKQDVLGHAVDAIMHLMDASTGATKDKLSAAAVVNELFGDKELVKDENLTDRLMINLVGKDK